MNAKQKIVILGGGESGAGSAVLARKQGFSVFLSDLGIIPDKYKALLHKHQIPFEEGRHSEELILAADRVIKSPGIPDSVPIVQLILKKEIPVVSEIEFAARYTKAKMICITGSNGKTTTTLLLYHILKKAGLKVGLAGNVGHSFAKQVAEEAFDYYVLELSSFQLDNMYSFKADIAILLNITPDHLDRYDNKMENYVNSKFRITQNQTENDAFIYCFDDTEVQKALKERDLDVRMYPFSLTEELALGAFADQEQLTIRTNKSEFKMSLSELSLQGKHNVNNAMAAGIAAKLCDIRSSSLRESLGDFQNVPHRLEHVGGIQGIEFINDSKATNVNSVWYALESVNTKIVWIVGGVDKGNDYSMLSDLVKDKVKAIVCLGKDNKKIHAAFEDLVDVLVNASSAGEAVQAAFRLASKGDTVLLSPACASFDLFKSYEDRGDQFKAAVKQL